VVNYKIWRDASRDITDPKEFATSHYDRPTMRKCWDLLDHSSRSFSMVIKELEGDLARVVRPSLLFSTAIADGVTDLYFLHRATSIGYYRGRHDTP
jgi:hypothetical protein